MHRFVINCLCLSADLFISLYLHFFSRCSLPSFFDPQITLLPNSVYYVCLLMFLCFIKFFYFPPVPNCCSFFALLCFHPLLFMYKQILGSCSVSSATHSPFPFSITMIHRLTSCPQKLLSACLYEAWHEDPKPCCMSAVSAYRASAK